MNADIKSCINCGSEFNVDKSHGSWVKKKFCGSLCRSEHKRKTIKSSGLCLRCKVRPTQDGYTRCPKCQELGRIENMIRYYNKNGTEYTDALNSRITAYESQYGPIKGSFSDNVEEQELLDNEVALNPFNTETITYTNKETIALSIKNDIKRLKLHRGSTQWILNR